MPEEVRTPVGYLVPVLQLGRRVRGSSTRYGSLTLLSALMIASLAGTSVASAKADLPDIDIMLVVEVHDTGGWLRMHQEVLRQPRGSGQALGVIVPTRSDGYQGITVNAPKFTAQIFTAGGPQYVKLFVLGKVSGNEALQELTPLERAALDIQAGGVPNRITLTYSLSEITGHLIEMHLSRP
jgi:hypothetical protein